MTVAANMARFVERLDGKAVIWGETDCTATPCRWLQQFGAIVDLPAYRSRDEAHALISQHGSLVAAWDHYLSQAGIAERFGDPQLGDVAVIDTRSYRQIGGIVANASILLVRKDDGQFQWFGPVRRFAKVWALP